MKENAPDGFSEKSPMGHKDKIAAAALVGVMAGVALDGASQAIHKGDEYLPTHNVSVEQLNVDINEGINHSIATIDAEIYKIEQEIHLMSFDGLADTEKVKKTEEVQKLMDTKLDALRGIKESLSKLASSNQ